MTLSLCLSGKSPGWQVTLCDPVWRVISHSGEVITTDFTDFWLFLFSLLNGFLFSSHFIYFLVYGAVR